MVGPDPLDAGALLSAFQSEHPGSGGIVSFTGQVRGEAGAVTTLHLQSHPILTEAAIADKITEARDRWPLDGVLIRHRTGDMAPAETIVVVMTAARHRRDAFASADFLMDYLKTEAIFWKKETTPDGATWIEPRPEDYKDAQRWKADP